MTRSRARGCGLLIAIEGIDGAGKTTQVRMLADALRRSGESTVMSKEPTGGTWGRLLRESASKGRLSLDEELQYFINDRMEHVRMLIRPALNAGEIVILDRYFYSTIAYQGSRGKSIEGLKASMEQIAPVPHVTFLLDLDPAEGIRRISESRNEQPNAFENLETLTRVRETFNAIKEPRIVKIDGSQNEYDVHRTIVRALVELAKGPMSRLANIQPLSEPGTTKPVF